MSATEKHEPNQGHCGQQPIPPVSTYHGAGHHRVASWPIGRLISNWLRRCLGIEDLAS